MWQRTCMHRDKFGWAQVKSDEVLKPVLAAYEARQAQLTMDQFLSFNQRFAKIRSKRLQSAVMQITRGAADPELMMGDVSNVPEGDDGERTGVMPSAGGSRPAATGMAGGHGVDGHGVDGRVQQDDEGSGYCNEAKQATPARQRGQKKRKKAGGASGGTGDAGPDTELGMVPETEDPTKEAAAGASDAQVVAAASGLEAAPQAVQIRGRPKRPRRQA
eukprot:365011-Chlamydomonas_euryale.AAC.6